MFMVDIAVPRDIEEEVSEVSDVYLYTVDDLRDIIEENIRSRESAAEQAETLIDSGVEQFMRDLKVLDAVKTITEVRTHVHDLKDEQLAIALKKLRSEEHTSELQSRPHLVCRLLLEKKKKKKKINK